MLFYKFVHSLLKGSKDRMDLAFFMKPTALDTLEKRTLNMVFPIKRIVNLQTKILGCIKDF